MFAYTKGNFQDKTNYIHLNRYFDKAVKYFLTRGSFGSKDCTEKLKLECTYFLGQTS